MSQLPHNKSLIGGFKSEMSGGKVLYSLFLAYASLLIFTPIFLGGDLHITIHDNLDSSIVWLKSMRENNAFFDSNSQLPFLGGLSRHYLPSELQLNNLMFNWMPAIDAYTLSYLIKVIIGTTSFFLLLRKYFGKAYSSIILCCAFTYSILPIYPNLYFAQASIPLFIYLFLSYTDKPSLKTAICLFLFPILSELPRVGIFLLLYATLYLLYNLIHKREKAFYSLAAILFFSISYLITEYHLFHLLFLEGNESIRSEFSPYAEGGLPKTFAKALIRGQYHAPTLNSLTGFCGAIFYYVFTLHKKPKFKKASFYIIICLVANTLIYTINASPDMKVLLSSYIGGLRQWNFGRFIWLNPFLWTVLLTIISIDLSRYINKSLIYALLLVNLVYISAQPVPYNDLANTISFHLSKEDYLTHDRYFANQLTYDQFFSTQDFTGLKEEINYSGQPALAFGMHPSVLVFNNIKTLDMYHSAYNLSYKHQFRDLIAPTLDRNDNARRYFDSFGGRAYLFSPDKVHGLGSYVPTLRPKPFLDNSAIFIDVDSAGEMGLKYIFSRYKISNPLENSLKLIAKTKGEVYSIYAYEFNK